MTQRQISLLTESQQLGYSIGMICPNSQNTPQCSEELKVLRNPPQPGEMGRWVDGHLKRGTNHGKPIWDRFWEKVDIKSKDDCWIWLGAVRGQYGRILTEHGKHDGAHRVCWMLVFGEIASGLLVCHRCDNPPCVNPYHLFLGDSTANNRDMVQKKRNLPPIGERNGQCKLTAASVLRVKCLLFQGVSQKSIALELNVDPSTVSLIANGKRWKSLL